MENKICPRCNEFKSTSLFGNSKTKADGKYPICKPCLSSSYRKRRTYESVIIDDIEGEVWKDIAGFEGYYQVSNIGRVKGLFRSQKINEAMGRVNKAKLIVGKINRGGYRSVLLTKDGKRKHITVHRLVGCAFIDNPNNYPVINHKDCNRTNNCVLNLEWTTTKGNAEHAAKYGNLRRGKTSLFSKPVNQYTMNNVFVKSHDTTKDASKEVKCSRHDISRCCKGIYDSYKGFIWRYAS